MNTLRKKSGKVAWLVDLGTFLGGRMKEVLDDGDGWSPLSGTQAQGSSQSIKPLDFRPNFPNAFRPYFLTSEPKERDGPRRDCN